MCGTICPDTSTEKLVLNSLGGPGRGLIDMNFRDLNIQDWRCNLRADFLIHTSLKMHLAILSF